METSDKGDPEVRRLVWHTCFSVAAFGVSAAVFVNSLTSNFYTYPEGSDVLAPTGVLLASAFWVFTCVYSLANRANWWYGRLRETEKKWFSTEGGKRELEQKHAFYQQLMANSKLAKDPSCASSSR